MNGGRFAMFLAIVLSIWAVMHAYVFWRIAMVPWVTNHLSRRTLIIIAVTLWLSYVIARFMDSRGWQDFSWPLEYFAANWIGVLFLLFVVFLVLDAVTLGGWLLRDKAPQAGGWAMVLAGFLALIGFVQAFRRPVVTQHEVTLPGLPPERDGLVLVHISDLHLGNLLGRRWLGDLVEQVDQLEPDLIALVGDAVDGNVGRVELLLPALSRLKAPLGVWAVSGNHEYYAGLEKSIRLLRSAGFNVLRDEAAQVVPGLIIAGVDDLTAREQYGQTGTPVIDALKDRPKGACILLSHSPLRAEIAAASGASLMLSGHTHNGQIWPFTYIVRARYPLISGIYKVDEMTVIVCRGTGTWGPRMRLWQPSQIVKITLRSPL